MLQELIYSGKQRVTFCFLFNLLFPQLLRKTSNIVILYVFKNILDLEQRGSVIDYPYIFSCDNNQEFLCLWTNT